MSLQTLISQANQRSEKGRKKVYVKKASDSQLLAQLVDAAKKTITAYRTSSAASGGAIVATPLHESLRELDLLCSVVDKRSR